MGKDANIVREENAMNMEDNNYKYNNNNSLRKSKGNNFVKSFNDQHKLVFQKRPSFSSYQYQHPQHQQDSISPRKYSPRKHSPRGYNNDEEIKYGEKKKINAQVTLTIGKLIEQSEEEEKKSGESSGTNLSAKRSSLVSIAEIEPLLSLGASTGYKIDAYRGCTLLHLASGFLNPNLPANLPLLARLLRESEIEDLLVLNDEGYNVFHFAAETENFEIMKLLVERLNIEKPKTIHSVINEKAGTQLQNRTPLHIAALTHNKEILNILVQNNADGNIRDINNQTAFELALLSEANQEILDILSQTTKVLKVMKKCLNNFSIKDCRNVIYKLSKLRMNFKLRNRKNNTPLMIAAQFGDSELLKELIELAKQHKTEGLEALDDNFHTALHFSCSWGHFECVRLLLEAGANKEATDNQGNTPLCRASQWNRADVCKLLLEAGANANAVSSFNKTPLELAFVKGLNNCENPHWDVINVLLPYTDLSKLLFKHENAAEKICYYAR